MLNQAWSFEKKGEKVALAQAAELQTVYRSSVGSTQLV